MKVIKWDWKWFNVIENYWKWLNDIECSESDWKLSKVIEIDWM
jgi:hypothetical protein